MTTGELPVFSAMQDAPDAERERALLFQSNYPAELVDPADVFGDDAWADMSRRAAIGGGDAYGDFAYAWGWELSRQQRADMLSRAVVDREMKAFINASAAPRPVVDPLEFAAEIGARRLERARG